MSDKNEIIRSAAAQVAENYRKSDILMYGDALRLPSRTAVIEIIRDFQKILFPAYYGDRDLLKLPPEQYSALLMGHVYDKLLRQLELVMPEGEEGARRAEKVCEAMMERLPHIQELLLKDLTANYNGDPAASSRQEIILSYPGMFAIFIYRIAHELYLEKVPMIPRIMTEYAHSQTGIDINPGATIGEYFSIDHGTGVVVGETTVIGDRVQLYQGVTLGAMSPAGMHHSAETPARRHPKVGSDVTIYAGATLLGGATEVGDNVVPDRVGRERHQGEHQEAGDDLPREGRPVLKTEMEKPASNDAGFSNGKNRGEFRSLEVLAHTCERAGYSSSSGRATCVTNFAGSLCCGGPSR